MSSPFNRRASAGLAAGNNSFPTLPTTSLWGWWRADRAFTDAGKTTLCASSGSDTCYTLEDQSGNGRDLVQATSSARPTWYSNQVNGYPSIDFDGSTDYMALTATQAQPVAIYMVLKQKTWTSGEYILSTNTSSGTLIAQRTATPKIEMYGGSSFFGGDNLPLTLWGLLQAVADGASSFVRINANPDLTGSGGTGGIVDGITMGSNAGTLSTFADYALAEMMVYSASHKSCTGGGLQVRKYLRQKYNLF